MSIELMTAREFLQQAQNIEANIREMEEQLEVLRERMTDTSAKINDMPRAASPDQQPLERLVARAVDLEHAIDAERQRRLTVVSEINEVVLQVQPARNQKILIAYYLHNRTWEAISAMMNISPTSLFRYHSKAIKAVEKLLESGVQDEVEVCGSNLVVGGSSVGVT